MSSSILVELHKLDGHCCSASLSSTTWFFLPRGWLLRRNRPQWGFVKLHRSLTQTWCQMDDASPWWPTDAHGRASWLRRLMKLIDFQWKASCLPSVLFACYAQRWYPSSVHLGCIGDAVVFQFWCNFITQLAMNQMFPQRRIDVGTKSISFVLISKPSHNFVSSSPVILFVQLLTLI